MEDFNFFDEFGLLRGDEETVLIVMEGDISEEPLSMGYGQYFLDESGYPVASIDA